MPIDFDAVTAAFSAPLSHELQQLQPIFTRLGDLFDDALKDVEDRERSMHAYPLLDWNDGALTVTVASTQRGLLMLPTSAPEPLGARMLATVTGAADRFTAGLGWISTAVAQELIIPRTLEIPVQALDAILASLERFQSPSADMFDPSRRTFSDLFGELGLAFRMIVADRAAVHRFVDGVWALKFASLVVSPPSASGADAPEVPLPERLQALGEYVLAAVLLLPLAGEWIQAGLAPAVDTIKLGLLQVFSRLEAHGDRFRAATVDLVISAMQAGAHAERYLQAAAAILPGYVATASRLTEFWAAQVFAGLRDYLTAVSEWLRHYTDWMATLQSALDGLMDIDLMPILLAAAGIPALSLLPDPPRFTLGDLIDTEGAVATSGPARFLLRQWLTGVSAVADQVPLVGDSLRRRVDALSEALDILLTPTPMPPEARLPVLAAFPDIGEALFGSGRAEALGAALLDLGEAMRGLVGSALRNTASAVRQLADVGADAAARAATIDSPQQFAEIARRAHDQAAGAFAGPLGEVQAEMDRQGPDALADSFESAVAGGGIQAAGAAIPAYVAEVRRYWEQRQPPTSPHILARHHQIERVRVPRIVIHAGARTPDAALADEIGLRFRAAVGEAYDAGRRKLEAAA